MIIDSSAMESCRNQALLPVLRRLKRYEKYCNLLQGGLSSYVRTFERIGAMPEQLKEFLKIFDGGLLFTTTMLSMRDKEAGKFNRLLTFGEINDPAFKKENGIPEEIVIFAMTNYGNYYCYVSGEKEGWVYEWEAGENALLVKWDSFAQWLDEQIDFAVSLIRDDLLDPVEV